MKKILNLFALIALYSLLVSCGQADTTPGPRNIDESQFSDIIQTAQGGNTEETTTVETKFDKTNLNLDPRLFTVAELNQLQTVDELTLVLTYETSEETVSDYLNQWIIVEAITPYDFSDKRNAIYTNYDNTVYFIDHDELVTAQEAPQVDGESGFKILCYLTEEEPGSYIMNQSVYMGSSATENDTSWDSGDSESINSNQSIEDYIQSKNDPNAPIDDQIIDGIGDAFDYAAQDPNQSAENRQFAESFGDAWDFAAALKRAGY